MHSLGEVTLGGNFEKKRVDLVVSTVQAAILVLFNGDTEISIQKVQDMTGLTAEDTKKYLKSLCSGTHAGFTASLDSNIALTERVRGNMAAKFKILIKRPAEGYAPNHVLTVNGAFTHQQRRVRIPHVPTKDAAAERETSQTAVSEVRCARRIMRFVMLFCHLLPLFE